MHPQASLWYVMASFVLLFPSFSWRQNLRDAAGHISNKNHDIEVLSNVKDTDEKFVFNYQLQSFSTVSTFAVALNFGNDKFEHQNKTEAAKNFDLFKRMRRRKQKFNHRRGHWGHRTVLGTRSSVSPKRSRQLGRHRKKLQNVLRELKVEEVSGPQETCGTRWSKSLNEEWNSRFQPLKTYGTLKDASETKDRNRRHAAEASAVSPQKSTLYFPGYISLVWSPSYVETNINLTLQNLHLDSFTVEVWVKPEGGQNNPTAILGEESFNNCFDCRKSLSMTRR